MARLTRRDGSGRAFLGSSPKQTKSNRRLGLHREEEDDDDDEERLMMMVSSD